MKKIGLKTKISVNVIGVGLVFAILGAILVFFYSQNELINQEKTFLLDRVKIYQEQISTIFDFNQDVVKTIAQEPAIVEYLRMVKQSPNFTPYEQYDANTNSYVEISTGAMLRRLIMYNIGEHYDIIYLLDTSGNAIVSTNASLLGNNYAFRDYFTQAMAGKSAIAMAIGVTTKKPGYYFSYPVLDKNGQILGVAVVKQSNQYIDKVFSGNGHAGVESVMLTDDYGVVLSSNNKEYVYRSLGELSAINREQLIKDRKYENTTITPIYSTISGDTLSQIKSAMILNDYYSSITTADRLIAVMPIAETGFFLVFDKDLKSYVQKSYALSLYISIFIVILGLASLLTISWLLSLFLKPFYRLKDGIAVYTQGNREYRFSETGDKEIVEFGQVFNQMADRNKKLYQDLQRKVEKLNRVNEVMIGREKKMIELKNKLKSSK
jgi:methyl-accepting chemotaxis protein